MKMLSFNGLQSFLACVTISAVLTFASIPRSASAQYARHTSSNSTPTSLAHVRDSALSHLLKKASELQFIHAKPQAEIAEQARNLALERRDTFAFIQSCCLLGVAYQELGAQDRAAFFYRKSLDYAARSGDYRAIAHACNSASEMYRTMLLYDSAHFYADRALRFALQANDSVVYARALGNKGQVLVRERKFDEALALFRRALPIFQRSGETGYAVRTLLRMGYALGLKGDQEQETELYEQAFQISKNKGYTLTMAEAAHSIGESMFHLKRFDVALPHLRYALQLADSLGNQIIQQEASLFLSQLCEAQGDTAEAFRYYKQFIRAVERGKSAQLPELQVAEIKRYEQLIRYQQEILMQREAAEAQMRQTIAGVSSALLLLVAVAGLLYWRSNVNQRARRRDEELQLFASYTSDVITRHDAQGLYRYVSPGISNLLGYAPEDLLGKNPYPLIHPNDVPRVKTAYKQALVTKEAGMQSLRFKKKNGEYLWIEVAFKPIIGADGEIKEFIHTTRDISDRVKAEERLRASEATLRATLYNTPNVAVQWYDETGRIILWNNASETMFGWSEKEALGKTLDQLFYTPEEFATFLRIAQQILKSGLTFGPFEYEFRRRDGRTAHGQSTMFTIPAPADGDSSQKIVVCMDLDITERKNAEIALRQNEERLRSIVEAMSEGLVLYNRDGAVIFCNPAAARILGVSESELLRATSLDFEAQTFREDGAPFLAKDHPVSFTLSTGKPQSDVIMGLRRSDAENNVVWMSINSRPIFHPNDAPDAPSAVVVTITDVSERKEVELLIQEQLNALEAKNAEMERFIYTISHDLKSPLITIKGFLDMIEEDVAAGDYSRVANDLKRIDNAANRMQNLLKDLLELSRVGRVVNPSERFSLTVLANETVELLHGILTQRNVRVVVQPNLPCIVADKARFREVFQNLIENASKFMGAQTEPRIEIGMLNDDIEPIYFVRDNGVGIAKEYQERIFGLFDKLDQHSDGTGIGLALVKRIIELHGGRIWVESEPGKGATFFFTCKTAGENAEDASAL